MSLIISQYALVGQEFFSLFNGFFYLIGFPVDSVNYNYECWFYQSVGSANDLYAYYASVISLCEPLSKILFVFFVWVVKRIFKLNRIKNRYFIISITSFILIEQLGVIKILLGSFKCISLDSGGSYMERNPNVSCDTDTYAYFSYFLYVPMIILWAGGFTLLLFFYICRNKVKTFFPFIMNNQIVLSIVFLQLQADPRIEANETLLWVLLHVLPSKILLLGYHYLLDEATAADLELLPPQQ